MYCILHTKKNQIKNLLNTDLEYKSAPTTFKLTNNLLDLLKLKLKAAKYM